MNPSKRCSVVMLIAVATLSHSAACQRIANTSGTETVAEHDHFPAHWPTTIFVASERLAAIQNREGHASSHDGVSPEQELIDLVRWLPELAADSDLDEATFNKIDSWSSNTLQKLEPKWSEGATLELLLAVDGLSKGIAEVQDIVEKEADRVASIQAK